MGYLELDGNRIAIAPCVLYKAESVIRSTRCQSQFKVVVSFAFYDNVSKQKERKK